MPAYTPGNMPQDPADLPGFIADELNRIAINLNGAVRRSYGGMVQRVFDAGFTLTTTPTVFSGWDEIVPSRPDGVLVTLITGSLEILTAGIYQLTFGLTFSNLPNNILIDVGLYVNGVVVREGRMDPSNQTDSFTVTLTTLALAVKGDIVDIRLSSPQGPVQLDILGGSFMVTRISDQLD